MFVLHNEWTVIRCMVFKRVCNMYTVHCLFGLHDTFYTELLFMRNVRRYFAMMWPEILDVYKYIIDYSDFIVHAGKAT